MPAFIFQLFNMCRQFLLKLYETLHSGIDQNADFSGSGANSWSVPLGNNKLYFYDTCSGFAASSPPDKYVITPKIGIRPAKRVKITVGYEINKCAGTGKPFCKEYFEVYVSKLQSESRPFDVRDYVYITTLNGTSSNSSEAWVDMESKYSLKIAFRDQGSCGAIKSLQLSYLNCIVNAENLVKFVETPAPASSNITITAKCEDYSIPAPPATALTAVCFVNGTTSTNGKCICKEGYEMKQAACKACPKKFFKTSSGNDACLPCGDNVETMKEPRKTCPCLNGYYRPTNKLGDWKVNCEKPPSNPRNVNASDITSNSAVITWLSPNDQGTGGPVNYRIVCNSCHGKTEYTANETESNFTLSGLGSYKMYNISVIAINNVTEVIGKSNEEDIVFRTKSGVPGNVRDLKIKLNTNGSITLIWKEPYATGGPDIEYVVTYGGKTIITGKRSVIIPQPEEDTTYTFIVRARTSAGESSPVVSEKIKVQGSKKAGVSLEIAIAVGVSLFVLLILVTAIAIYYWRRRHPKHLQAVRYATGEVKLPKFSGSAKVYIDPTTYQDLTEAVREFAKELEKSWVTLENIIGGGEFGDVYKGMLRRQDNASRSSDYKTHLLPSEDIEGKPVAVKTLRNGSDRQAKDDFLGEAAIMAQFEDPNIIVLEGVVVKERPVMIVTEFMSNGSLDQFLQENDGKFTPLQLLGMARGVASGMTYLAEMGFIHRDLAARNILVDSDHVCKVADFGMSRELKVEDTYDTKGGKIPVRWTAPEAIQYKKFTTASDVWSYGILLWEIMSYGERPYWDWGNYEVLERIGSGYRLPPPMGCPKVVHDLMLSCWNKDRVKRPKFRSVRETIDKWIRNTELLKQDASVVKKVDEHLDYASMQTIKEWLDSIKMGQYARNFTDEGYSTPRQIFDITDQRLQELGIQLLGHRNKILKNIQTTKDQVMKKQIERTKSMKI